MKLFLLASFLFALCALHRAEEPPPTDCEHPGHCMTDPNRPTCTGITYENGTFANGKCLSSGDAKVFYWNLIKNCYEAFEKAGGCECNGFDFSHPDCTITTNQELRDMFTEECRFWKFTVFKYCDAKKDICSALNGKAHRRFASNPTCCHTNCPRCGGKGCAKYTDGSGNELGAQQCCGQRILKRGKFCESEGQTAPCKVQFTENDILDHLNNIVNPPEKYF